LRWVSSDLRNFSRVFYLSVARVFVTFACVPFGVDFGTAVESFERNLRLPFTPLWSPFPVLHRPGKFMTHTDPSNPE
jgi:hypothetical protein